MQENVPHQRRPAMGRFPDGVEGRGFGQTECRGAPDWISAHEIELRNGKRRSYCLIDVHLDPMDKSAALGRLAERLADRLGKKR